MQQDKVNNPAPKMQSQTRLQDTLVWVGATPYKLEVMETFLRQAEESRETLKGTYTLYTILTVAQNRGNVENYLEEFERGHPWLVNQGFRQVALALAPVFYKIGPGTGLSYDSVSQIEDSVAGLECNGELDRDTLRSILDGVF